MKSLTKTFMKNMIGPLSGLAVGLAAVVTVIPAAPAEAQQRYTTQQDVNDFNAVIGRFSDRFSRITPAQEAAINALYQEMQEFYLADPARPNPNGFFSDITNHAGAVAGQYDMGNNRLYTDLMNSIGLHSLYAETALTKSMLQGQNTELAHSRDSDLVGVKLQAMIDIQYRLARFVEQTAIQVAEDRNLSSETFHSYSTLCHLARRFEDRMKDIHMAVLPANNIGNPHERAMTVEDHASDYTKALDCTRIPSRPLGSLK